MRTVVRSRIIGVAEDVWNALLHSPEGIRRDFYRRLVAAGSDALARARREIADDGSVQGRARFARSVASLMSAIS
jgi:hypothetical protein